jgi:CheY-like chemotaxis protein
MFNDTRLLVVDDEETICQGCQRILTPEGFQVETTSDAHQGLRLAVDNDYAAVLLDIRMPQMDGIEFLEKLRKANRQVPVIIITGYPSIASAASAMRWGAVDYVTKPFTPRAIMRAVRRSLRPRRAREPQELGPAAPAVQPWIPASTEFRYWDESWFQPLVGGNVRVGAMLPRAQGVTVEAVWPPRVGWTVYQGLPLAGITLSGRLHLTVPAPVSGEVVASNELLLPCPSVLWDDPCNNGWIACIRPSRPEQEFKRCKCRRMVLANADKASADAQSAHLMSLGCQVAIADGLGAVGPLLEQDPDCHVLMMDAESLGEHGPELVRRIQATRRLLRVVVIAPRHCRWESAYRQQSIFYYGVEPFSDNEIVDIVDSAFRPRPPRCAQRKHDKAMSTAMDRICVTRCDGEQVGLVTESGLLHKDLGLGLHIVHRLADRAHSLETMLTRKGLPEAVPELARSCKHVLVLLARDVGRLPGSLVREERVPIPGQQAEKMTALIIQRATSAQDPLDFDIRTTAALAEHIVHEMTVG